MTVKDKDVGVASSTAFDKAEQHVQVVSNPITAGQTKVDTVAATDSSENSFLRHKEESEGIFILCSFLLY